MGIFKKGDKVTVNWPSHDLYDTQGKILGKVTKNIPASSTMRTGDWYFVDFGGYDGLLKVYQDYIKKESKGESTMKRLSEAEKLLNEVLGGKKQTLKKEANENLSVFNLKKLTPAQIDQALENRGYSDNRVTKAAFKKVSVKSGEIFFYYRCEFDDESGPIGGIVISIAEDGFIGGEFTGLD